MVTTVDAYFTSGCGRCPKLGAPGRNKIAIGSKFTI